MEFEKRVEGEKSREPTWNTIERSSVDIKQSRRFAEELMRTHEKDVRAGKKEHTASFDRIDPGKQEDFVTLFLDGRTPDDLRTFIGELGKGNKRFRTMVEMRIGGSSRAEAKPQSAIPKVEKKRSADEDALATATIRAYEEKLKKDIEKKAA